jgi:sodium-independent sulfate anion transporter 11
MVGTYALVVGLLKLGFLLDFVSASVLSGWISAVAIVIGLGQVGSLIGMTTPSTTAAIIRTVVGNLWEVKPMTLCIGFTSLAAIILLEQVGKIWGKKNKWVKIISTSRAVIVLFIFTIMSWGVNRNRDKKDYMWAIIEVDTNGLITPKTHDSSLLSKVIPYSFAPMIAMSVEHLGVGKAFGLRNDYTIDKSQELVYLGVNNMVNSLLGGQTTGAAMSRTAVCSECNVRTPLNFAFTAGFIILTLYELAPALYWIPKATLSAIIVSTT